MINEGLAQAPSSYCVRRGLPRGRRAVDQQFGSVKPVAVDSSENYIAMAARRADERVGSAHHWVDFSCYSKIFSTAIWCDRIRR